MPPETGGIFDYSNVFLNCFKSTTLPVSLDSSIAKAIRWLSVLLEIELRESSV